MSTNKVDAQQQRVNSIICIAHTLFEQHGYEKVGIRDICQPAGISPTQLYRLGLSKQDLLAEVILRINQQQIKNIETFKYIKGKSLQSFIENFLLNLYESDISIKSIRTEGAAFGWKWSEKYEELITKQVGLLLKPIADALELDTYNDIPARCFAIWSLYYVGYRHAVMKNGSAQECLEVIKPSLNLCLKK